MATGDRLTVQLEDGRGAQLRTLAGGERKVGRFLSDAIRFLATYSEVISENEFQDLCILPRISTGSLPQVALQEIDVNYDVWRRELEARALGAEQRAQEAEQRMEQQAQSLAQLETRQSAIEAQLAQLGYVPIAGVATPQ